MLAILASNSSFSILLATKFMNCNRKDPYCQGFTNTC
jgi:hypothetical protein